MLLNLEIGLNNTILRTKALPVIIESPGFDVVQFSQNMIETMQNEKGVGLAAPQVGKSIRMIVVGSENQPIAMINPEITFFSKETVVANEGCLSLPGEEYKIERAKKIRFKYYDIDGRKVKMKAKGLLARVVQHEIDHLDGILIPDKVYGE